MSEDPNQEKIRRSVEIVLERFAQDQKGQVNLNSSAARLVIAKEVARVLTDSDHFFLSREVNT